MVNSRVLELLKNPKNIQSEDLHLLKEEINSFPYIQNIRALHLYGVHLYDKENYQKELSTTAAYTTDKKILYHLINGKNPQIKIEKKEEKPFVIQNRYEGFPLPKAEKPIVETEEFSQKHDYETISESLITPKPEIKNVFVNGERNRILFEGEENFLNEESETIDLESTLESGVIVTQKQISPDENINQSEIETDFVAAPSEEIINEDKIDSETVVEKINDETELSFQKVESFESKTEVLEEEIVQDETLADAVNEEKSADLNIETVINEDKIDSEVFAEKINNEDELSFLKIESLKPEIEDIAEEPFQNEIVVESVESEEITEVLNTETIIEEDKIDSQIVAEKLNNDAELSFHGTDSFLPEIKIESNSTQEIVSEIPKSNINKHEDEMRRLIEEVEKKMKAQKKDEEDKPKVEEETLNGEISFAETQAFHVGEEQKAAEEVVVKIAESIVEEGLHEQEPKKAEEVAEAISTWKPMSFESHTPDSFSRKVEIQAEPVEKAEEIIEVSEVVSQEENKEVTTENSSQEILAEIESVEEPVEAEPTVSVKDDEVPVMNVSFFGSDISSLPIEKEEKEKPQPIERVHKPILKTESSILDDSNVPGFINTWQSWLKIDRTEEIEKVKIENKNKAIESFIENNPKISQLKDEVNFVVKEKTDDISHLMTETLANLYIEQKLYTKAINAFTILVNKHPDRKEYFENKIQEIKDNRGKTN